MHASSRPAPAVLLVDDDPTILRLVTRALRGCIGGYELVAVADGEQALPYLVQRAIPLIITDNNMPGISGLQLADIVKARHPETCVILVSADTISPLERQRVDYYLCKPFPIQQLQAIVRDVLANAAQQAPPSDPAHECADIT
jgi:two-component system, response regulator, stage 0 sporulation protein F